MTIQEIIAEITQLHRRFPGDVVAEAISRREEITPELLHILEDALINLEDLARRNEYAGPVTAMYLLAQFREKRAYPIIMNLISAEWEHVDAVFSDLITEVFGRVLASVCDGDIAPICALIENEKLNEYIRSAGLDALVVLVTQGAKTREEIMTYFLSLFQGGLEREPSIVWSSLVCSCCDIYPIEAEVEIYRAFDDDLVYEDMITPDDVERHLRTDKVEKLRKLAKDPHNTFVNDTIDELSRWLCTHEFVEPKKSSDWKQEIWTPAPAPSGIKVGRNDPCPCGSGKKYKKCCLE